MKLEEPEPFQPEFAKPGKPTKKPRNNQKQIGRGLTPPEKKHCRRCDVETGREAFRHAEARLIKYYFSGGGIVGGRISDMLTAWLCDKCDAELSEPIRKEAPPSEEFEHAYYWQKYIILTHLL